MIEPYDSLCTRDVFQTIFNTYVGALLRKWLTAKSCRLIPQQRLQHTDV